MVTKKIQSGFSAILIVVLMVVLASLVLGGIYYYSEIYQPKQYAKTIISLFDKVTDRLQQREQKDSSRLKDNKDYQGALEIVLERQKFLEEIQTQLQALKAPRKFKQTHEDFQVVLGWLIDANARFEKMIDLATKGWEFYDLIKVDIPQGQTVGQFLTIWEVRLPKAKVAALKLFQSELPPGSDEASWNKMKTLWQEAEEGLDASLAYFRAQDKNLPMSDMSEKINKELTQTEQDKIAKVNKIDELLPLLESKIVIYTADRIAATTFPDPPQDINSRGQRLDSTIKELKQKYQKSWLKKKKN